MHTRRPGNLKGAGSLFTTQAQGMDSAWAGDASWAPSGNSDLSCQDVAQMIP